MEHGRINVFPVQTNGKEPIWEKIRKWLTMNRLTWKYARSSVKFWNHIPAFANDFFRAVSTTTSTSTRIKYAYDLRIFFQFLLMENPVFQNCTVDDLTLDVLDSITALDIEEYIELSEGLQGFQGWIHHKRWKGVETKTVQSPHLFNSTFSKRKWFRPILPCLWTCRNFMKKKLSVWTRMKWPGFWISWKAAAKADAPPESILWKDKGTRSCNHHSPAWHRNSGVRVRRPGCWGRGFQE